MTCSRYVRVCRLNNVSYYFHGFVKERGLLVLTCRDWRLKIGHVLSGAWAALPLDGKADKQVSMCGRNRPPQKGGPGLGYSTVPKIFQSYENHTASS